MHRQTKQTIPILNKHTIMAHNIEVYKNAQGEVKESFVGHGPAWHGLGKVYDRPLTVAEALEGCNADYEVTKRHIITVSDELMEMINAGDMIDGSLLQNFIVANKMATYREDRDIALGLVSDSYGVIQNADAFKFVDNLCSGGAGAPIINAAGVLGQGERIFITAKFPEPIILNHKTDDIVDMYIVFTTSHDGSGGCCAMVTPTRVVCQNTLCAAFQNNVGRWNVKHTTNAQSRLSDIEDAAISLKMYNIYKMEFERKMEQLAKVKITDNDVERICAQVSMTPKLFQRYVEADFNLDCDEIGNRSRNRVIEMVNSVYTGVGQEEMYGEGNGLWLYNGITTHLSNETTYKNPSRRFSSLIDETGTSFGKATKAVKLILEHA